MCDNWFDLLASHSLLSEGPDIAQGDRPPVTYLNMEVFISSSISLPYFWCLCFFSSSRTMNFSFGVTKITFGVTKITLGVIKITLGVLFNNPALFNNNPALLENNPALFI